MDEFHKWKLDSIAYQQTFYERFGDRDWDSIPREDTNSLNTKVSYSLYGKPFESCDPLEAKFVEDTRNKVIELNGNGNVNFACVFICVLLKKSKEPYIFSLIRTKPTNGKSALFIERQPGRVYTGFADFLKNNKLPKCLMCFPKSGFYRACDGRVKVKFQDSPSCSITFKVLDVVSSIGKAASAGLLAVSTFFPILSPIMIVSAVLLGGTTGYSATRSIMHLVDRDKHHESISVVNTDARLIWFEMCNDIIGSILAGGAAALPRLVNSGRFTVSAMTTALDVLSCVSVGVNGFGIVANIATLIVKYRNGTLGRNDIDCFISSCLFIGNVIVSTMIANQIIRELSDRPSHLYRLFQMTSNTSFKAVKTTITCFSVDAAIEIICGNPAEKFFKFFDLPYTGSVAKEVGNILKKFKQKNNNTPQLCFELYKLLTNHLRQVQTEVDEAMFKLNHLCKYLANQRLTIKGKIFFRDSQLLAPEIVRSVGSVVENLSIADEVIRDNSACVVMKLAVELGRETDVKNEKQFTDMCKILMNEIKSRCNQRVTLYEAEGKSVAQCDKQTILDLVVRELRNQFKNHASFLPGTEQVIRQSDEPLLRPLYKTENVEAYAFDVGTSFGVLDQFVNDAACKLFNVDCLPGDTYVHSDGERTVVVRIEDKAIVFFYERQLHAKIIFGIALMAVESS